MRIPHAALGPLAFALGVALRAAPVVLRRPRPGDFRRLALAFAIGLVGLTPGRNERPYSPQLHLQLAVAAIAVGVAWQFRERLVPFVGARLLLVWSLLALAALWGVDGHAGGWILLALLGVAVAITNAVTGLERWLGWQVFLLAGFVATLVLLAALAWHIPAWTRLDVVADALNTRSVLGNVLAGAAFVSVAANAWCVLALVPLRPGQSAGDRLGAIRGRLDRLARGGVWEPHHRMRSLAVLVLLPLALAANAWRPVVDPPRLVFAVIALMPLVANAEPRGTS